MRHMKQYLDKGPKKLCLNRAIEVSSFEPSVTLETLDEITPQKRHRRYLTICKHHSVSQMKMMS